MLHPWLEGNSDSVAADSLEIAGARAVLQFLLKDTQGTAHLVETRRGRIGREEIVIARVRVDRPQDRAEDIRREELIGLVFSARDLPPCVLALRPDFPDTPHQNAVPLGCPASICVDDRPWAEARLSWSAANLIHRIRTWLGRAVRGELVDQAQPVEPLFLRTGGVLILSSAVLDAAEEPTELFAYANVPDEQVTRILLTAPVPPQVQQNSKAPRLTVLVLPVAPRQMARLRNVPSNLAELAQVLCVAKIDLMGILKQRLIQWSGIDPHKKQKLASHLALVVCFEIVDPSNGRVVGVDRRAFCLLKNVGELGVSLGWLGQGQPGAGGRDAYVPIFGARNESDNVGADVLLEVMEVHQQFGRRIAAEISGRQQPDDRRVVMIGAGAVGSQIAMNLAREGTFRWTIVDDDYLLPHNLARHALPAEAIGWPKATAVAYCIKNVVGGEDCATGIVTNVINPVEAEAKRFQNALEMADMILDTSASVAAARHLSDLESTTARRFSVFFNPSGTAVVLLAEDRQRSITLRDLEAQYYRMITRDPRLRGHLQAGDGGVRYSGSCRTVTSRIPQSRTAIMSGIIAHALPSSLAATGSLISIWSIAADGGVSVIAAEGEPIAHKSELSSWSVSLDAGLLARVREMRTAQLPRETGGVLLGVVDMIARSIHVVDALPPPPDSQSSCGGFERGVRGLAESISDITQATMSQVQYVGEWHSHPRAASALPSGTDLSQIAWLHQHLAAEGLPPLMVIVADTTVSLIGVVN